MKSDILSQRELRRYNRHVILKEFGIEGQEKIKQAKVLVVGAGGLGAPVLQYLTAVGVGTIGIVDNDVVDESNMQRQILFHDHEIGKLKTIVAKDKLSILNQHVNINIHNIYFDKRVATELAANYDMIVDCTDNIESRYVINDTCVILGKPMIYGSVYKFEGQVAVFNYQGGPTYRCLYPKHEVGKTLKASETGILGVLPGIIGTIQASEVIKIITGTGTNLSGKVFYFNSLELSSYTFTVNKIEENTTLTDFMND